MPNPTFGFESEFQRNAAPLAAALTERGFCGGGTIHDWHCSCATCEDGEYDFKVQRDSTVNGEVISRVFHDFDEATFAMHGLQRAAVDVDAEPGWDAGLHVHVQEPRTPRDRTRALLAFIVWESAFMELAQGRFPHMRSMNQTVFDCIMSNLFVDGIVMGGRVNMRRGQTVEWLADAVQEARDTDDWADKAERLFSYHWSNDRHSNLSINTRFNTWEFRVWNSTRSAWRMELACRMAVAWYNPSFIDVLIDHEGERTLSTLRDMVALEWGGDARLTELVERQVAYVPIAEQTPAEFLVA